MTLKTISCALALMLGSTAVLSAQDSAAAPAPAPTLGVTEAVIAKSVVDRVPQDTAAAFPAWVAALSRAPASWTRSARISLLAAGIATSGLLTVGSATLRGVLREHSMFAWGGLVLVVVLLVERLRAPASQAALQPLEQGAHGR